MTGAHGDRARHEASAIKLAAHQLWKCFPKHDGFVAILENINLNISGGEFVCLVGPSGCGKSTLLSILAGLEKPTTGSVSYHGRRTEGPVPGSAFVFQRDLLLEWRTVLDNVLIAYQLRGESPKRHCDRAADLLARVGLKGCEKLYPWQLSGGMRQRVAICRALIDDPDVLFMDEPFGALDALTRERLNEDLLRISGTGNQRKTIVFVTHDVSESVFLGDRVIVMGATPGRIFADIGVELPHRRLEIRDAPEFAHLTAVVRSALRQQEEQMPREDGMVRV